LAGINSFFEHLAQFPSMGRLRGDIENNVLAIPLKKYVAPIKQGNTLMRMVGAPSRRKC
jgi:plasmid stabilization system protein ParE